MYIPVHTYTFYCEIKFLDEIHSNSICKGSFDKIVQEDTVSPITNENRDVKNSVYCGKLKIVRQ